MWPFETFGGAGGTLTLSLGTLAFAAMLVACVLLFPFLRSRAAGVLAGGGLFVALAWGAWTWGWAWDRHEIIEERRALTARMSALQAAALAPGSVLACLDGPWGDLVDGPCEARVFADPQNVAAALVLTAERLALLGQGRALARLYGPAADNVLDPLRHTLERDAFGFVAHVLASQHACAADSCAALMLVDDSSRVRANFAEHRFEKIAERHAADWNEKGVGELAQAAAPAPPPLRPLSPAYTLPSSASIPPVSIMIAEPTRPADNPPAAPEADAKAAPESAKPTANAKAPARPKRAARPQPPRARPAPEAGADPAPSGTPPPVEPAPEATPPRR